MKKTHSTNIGGRIFEVEEDAYQELTAYLVSIGARFQLYPDAKDIVADIEARIAEHLLLNAGTPHIVTRDDVTRVITAMGRVDQFGDTTEVPTISGGAPNETAGTAETTKFTDIPGSTATAEGAATAGIARPRLFRDPDERVIAGVAAGIAAYFDVSPAWIRLLFLVSLFIGGSGLLVYLALWVCVPKARTLTDRVRMRGERVTLDTIDRGLRDESLAVLPKRSSAIRTIFRILIACAVITSLLLTGMCIGVIGSDSGTWMANPWSEVDANSRVRIDTVISIASTPTVDLSAIAGDIHVTTGPRAQVKIVASTVGNAGIDFASTGSTVRVHEKLRHRFCRDCSATIDVTVPEGTSVVSTAVSGSQTVAVMHGDVRANAVSGDITVHDARTVTAETVAGDIDVTVPDTAHVTVEASSVAGEIETDFSSNVTRESGVGHHVIVPVNGGGAPIKATTVSGNIAVRRTNAGSHGVHP